MDADLPTSLGRYRLTRVLGRGAMGVVYEGVDTRLGRAVAVKTVLRSVLSDDATSADYAARFEREAQAAARLNHPNIVTVFDFGEHEQMSYIVMELIRGRDLGQSFNDGERFRPEEAVRIVGGLLDALAAAHAQGVVHRDVKPANVMIDETGRVKLADFGVARVVSANQDRTVPGTQVGTPSYMSPEQVLGLPVGSRADIFAAGVVLYQLLTGQRPFAGAGAFGVQRAIVQDEPLPPSQLDPMLPPGFDAVVARALAKQPEQRHETAADFAAELRRVMPAPAQPPVTAAAPTKTTRRPLVLWLGGAVALTWGTAAWLLLSRPAAVPPVDTARSPAASAPAASTPTPAAVTSAPTPAVVAVPAAPASPVAVAPAVRPASVPVARPPSPAVAVRGTPPRSGPKERPPPARPADPRCADLLMRMSLGDALSPEQTTYFHTRCAR